MYYKEKRIKEIKKEIAELQDQIADIRKTKYNEFGHICIQELCMKGIDLEHELEDLEDPCEA